MCCESGCESDPFSVLEFLPANQIDVGRFQLVLGEGLGYVGVMSQPGGVGE
jgi:hypothetical protein